MLFKLTFSFVIFYYRTVGVNRNHQVLSHNHPNNFRHLWIQFRSCLGFPTSCMIHLVQFGGIIQYLVSTMVVCHCAYTWMI